MLLSNFRDASILEMLFHCFLFLIFLLFSSFSLGSRHAPIFTRRAPHVYRRMPVIRWRAPFRLLLHIPGSF
jgi:hypothetical protein